MDTRNEEELNAGRLSRQAGLDHRSIYLRVDYLREVSENT